MLFRISGIDCTIMNLEDLVHAILGDRPLEARQWVADAARAGIRFDQLPLPDLESKRERALAARLAELSGRPGTARVDNRIWAPSCD